MFNMHYEFTHFNDTVDKIDVTIADDDISLGELFAHFVHMTDMMGYQPESWNKIIDEAYGCCVLNVDTKSDYNMFDYALDSMPIS